MIASFFRTAWRNMLKYKAYAAINLIGLTCGLTLALVIFTYVRQELNFDTFHSKIDRIYRLKYNGSNGMKLAACPPPIAPLMTEYFPEVQEAARVYSRNVSVSLPGDDTRSFEETNMMFADSSITKIWSLDFVAGDKRKALVEPFTILINEEMAKKYFGDKNPIGETLIFAGKQSFKVTGVVKDFPYNSHIHFNMLVPFDNMYDLETDQAAEIMRKNFEVNFIVSHSYTYVLLKEGADFHNVNARFDEFVKKYSLPIMQRGQSFELFPLADVHLKSDMLIEPGTINSYSTLYIFIGVGLLTLLIACINYINMATAQSFTRIKEIGIRKILGSARSQLIAQFLSESFLFCLVSFALSLIGLYVTLPYLNQLTGSELVFAKVLDAYTIGAALILLLLITLLAGGYPSIFVARFESVSSLKGNSVAGGSGNFLRKGLVVFQLVITCGLISGSLMIIKQLRYLENRPLGFEKENILIIPILSQNLNAVFVQNDAEQRVKLNTFRQIIERQFAIRSTALSNSVPGVGIVFRGVVPEGFTQDDNMFVANLGVDYDFLNTYKIDVVAGRQFDKGVAADSLGAFMVNETAVKEYKWGSPEEAIGRIINLEGNEGKVIGVVKDFNFTSLTTAISPLVMDIKRQFSILSISMQNENVQENIEFLRGQWNSIFPEKTFEFRFLDEQLNQQYLRYQNFGTIITYFTVIAVLISCLGVYGLILFVVQRKVKEIGVRKVLGATVFGILKLLFKEFGVLILIAFAVAIPFSYYLISQWFDNFVYHTGIDVFTYAISLLLVLVIVGATIAQNAMKAAMANPVTSLRNE